MKFKNDEKMAIHTFGIQAFKSDLLWRAVTVVYGMKRGGDHGNLKPYPNALKSLV